MTRDYWETRYQSGDMHWDKGAPSPGLVDFLAAHPEFGGGDALVAVAFVATGASPTPKSGCVARKSTSPGDGAPLSQCVSPDW